jgi:hypothetical protein
LGSPDVTIIGFHVVDATLGSPDDLFKIVR